LYAGKVAGQGHIDSDALRAKLDNARRLRAQNEKAP